MSTKLKVVIGTLVLIALSLTWLLLPVREWIEQLRDWIIGLGMVGVALFVALYVLITVALGPVWMLTLVAGLAYGLLGYPLVLCSATLAACTAFMIGRHIARERVITLVSEHRKLRALHRAVSEEGWRVVGMVRLSPVIPFGVQNYMFSVTDIAFLPYALATMAGILPGTAMYVYIGTLGNVGNEGGALRWVLIGAGLAATAAVVWLVSKRAQAELAKMDLDSESSIE